MSTDQEKLGTEQPRETESSTRELEEWEQALIGLTNRIDTLIQEAPDTFQQREILGHKKDNPTRLDIASLSGRQVVNQIDIAREGYEDGNKEYTVTYRATTAKDERDDNLSDDDVLTVGWHIGPDGALREGGIPVTPEALQTIASRITEFENSELGLGQASPEEIEWPSRAERARQFARRIFRSNR